MKSMKTVLTLYKLQLLGWLSREGRLRENCLSAIFTFIWYEFSDKTPDQDVIYSICVCIYVWYMMNDAYVWFALLSVSPRPDTWGFHRIDQEAAEATALQDVQCVDGGTPWWAHVVLQLAWVLLRVQQHLSCSLKRDRDQCIVYTATGRTHNSRNPCACTSFPC